MGLNLLNGRFSKLFSLSPMLLHKATFSCIWPVESQSPPPGSSLLHRATTIVPSVQSTSDVHTRALAPVLHEIHCKRYVRSHPFLISCLQPESILAGCFLEKYRCTSALTMKRCGSVLRVFTKGDGGLDCVASMQLLFKSLNYKTFESVC